MYSKLEFNKNFKINVFYIFLTNQSSHDTRKSRQWEKQFKTFLSLNFEVKSVFTFLSHSELPLSNDKVLEKIALGQIFCENLRREKKRGCKIMKFFRWYFFFLLLFAEMWKRFCYSILNDLFHCQKLAKCLRLYKSFAWWCSLDYILIFFVIRYYLLL